MSAEPFGSPDEEQAQEESVPGGDDSTALNGDAGDEDEDAITSRRRKTADVEADGADEQAGEDLFGDDEDDATAEEPEPHSYVGQTGHALRTHY